MILVTCRHTKFSGSIRLCMYICVKLYENMLRIRLHMEEIFKVVYRVHYITHSFGLFSIRVRLDLDIRLSENICVFCFVVLCYVIVYI